MRLGYARQLVQTVERVVARLEHLPTGTLTRRPGPGRWSIKEIVGHLVDSASNNHQRFVRARWQKDLIFPTYDQEGWVVAQEYQEAPWPELLALWRTYNLHLARVMDTTPDVLRLREHRRHNFDQVAFRSIPPDQPATLDYFMRDYVEHLEHHVRQIEELLPASGKDSQPRP
jgi:hypothetical protein